MAKNYGYARCSLNESHGQDLNRQTRELKAAGAEEIITEREHGDRRKPNLEFLLDHDGREVHADGVRGQQVVALSQRILRDAGNHPAEAPAADDPGLHHCGLQGRADGPHEHRLPSDGVHLQSAGTVPHKGARAVWRRQRQGQG